MNQLTRYDIACTALAEAKSVDEVKELTNLKKFISDWFLYANDNQGMRQK